jgi:hypothetical protein
MRDIDRFTTQFAPPRSPLAPGIEDVWPDMQHRIGSVLPRDYKDFINAFGSVLLNESLRPFNPFSRGISRNLLWQMGVQLGGMRELKQQFPENYPYPIWFEPGGLLPWGSDENAINLYWLTRGHPDQWTVVVEDIDAGPASRGRIRARRRSSPSRDRRQGVYVRVVSQKVQTTLAWPAPESASTVPMK